MPSHDNAADVCLVLEGGYPHITGGVSAWVDGLTRALPEVRFAIANVREQDDWLGTSAADQRIAYTLAENVVSLSEIQVERGQHRTPAALADQLPDAGIFHACITGFASDAAATAAARRGRPLLVTEHGMACREAPWIVCCTPPPPPPPPPPHGPSARASGDQRRERERRILRQAREAYAQAQAITSVCSSNVRAQRRMGAPAERSHLIVNCIPGRAPAPPAAAEETLGTRPFRVGFVGRIVPGKDLHTLLRAVASARTQTPVEAVIVGPLDHAPDYVESCFELARKLRLEPHVSFTGELEPLQWPGRFDALVLTSISEAQPLVLLEAMAAGLPCISSTVGGCAEVLAGPIDGSAVPPAGLLVPARDQDAVGRAVIALATDPGLCKRLGAAGRERVRMRHDPARVWDAYRTLYDRAAA